MGSPWRSSIPLAWLRAAEVATRQRSPETRRTYAAVYRTFLAFLGPQATATDLTAEAVRAYRDQLEHVGRTPATVAKHLSALRGLAEALGADVDLRSVRSARVGRGESRALSDEEWQRLLRMPDRRTRQGKRDLALLHLLGSAGDRARLAYAAYLSLLQMAREAPHRRLAGTDLGRLMTEVNSNQLGGSGFLILSAVVESERCSAVW
jgi:site-specific recombinase XerD